MVFEGWTWWWEGVLDRLVADNSIIIYIIILPSLLLASTPITHFKNSCVISMLILNWLKTNVCLNMRWLVRECNNHEGSKFTGIKEVSCFYKANASANVQDYTRCADIFACHHIMTRAEACKYAPTHTHTALLTKDTHRHDAVWRLKGMTSVPVSQVSSRQQGS